MHANVEYTSLETKHECHRPIDEATGARLLSRLDCDDHPKEFLERKEPGRSHGWLRGLSGSNVGLLWITFLTALITVVNIVLAATLMSIYPVQDGIGEALVGNCSTVASWSRWLHIGINVSSSALLGASNYCMQRLCAPTRDEVDREHSKGRWLDIGVPSLRNFRRISRDRQILWILLILSSVPLHLFYNSAVFTTLSAQQFHATLVTEGFLQGGTLDTYIVDTESLISYLPDLQHRAMINPETSKNLSNVECINKYSGNFVTDVGDLLAVSRESFSVDGINGTIGAISTAASGGANSIYYTALASNSNWLANPRVEGSLGHLFVCADHVSDDDNFGYSDRGCDIDGLLAAPESWTIADANIAYCLSEQRREQCKLQFSVPILWLVAASNVVKLACMLWSLLQLKQEPLVTLGDAISSFIEQPDVSTEGQCLLSKQDVLSSKWVPGTTVSMTFAQTGQRRWFCSASWMRWGACVLLCLVTLILSTVFLGIGIRTLRLSSATELWNMGFGALRADSLVAPSLGANLTGAVLLANLPQLIISFLYFLYNGLFTTMFASAEWMSFSVKRQPLRVTKPEGEQTDTYWLQLPYAFSVPILVAMTVLHWLVSQSIFLASITFYRDGVPADEEDARIMGCGYSCAAIIFAVTLGVLLLLMLVGTGFRIYPQDVPLVSTCSVAISSGCHAPIEDKEAALMLLQWGVVNCDGREHCCLTSYSVTAPIIGNVYY